MQMKVSWIQELHIQVIKYADSLADVTGKEFCEAVQIKDSYFAEFLCTRQK